jgi:ribosomal protein S18 acetylase RimI-like enzyme
MTAALDLVRAVEGLAFRAWPAAVVEPLDGWLLRCNEGVTRRANSVWPNHAHGRLSLAEKLTRVEDYYFGRGLPALYAISPAADPADLDALLAARGYRRTAPTLVQTAGMDVVLAHTDPGPHSLAVAERMQDAWMAAYAEAEEMSEAEARGRRAILERVAGKAGYALVSDGTRVRAVGLGVVEAGWLGIFSMSTQPAFRRRGAATALLHGLAAWGRGRGASQVYLQVMEDNPAAQAVYERAAFTTRYGYHYRTRAPGREGMATWG